MGLLITQLKERELQKNLFDFIGAGVVSPKFMVNKLFENENRKLKLEFIDLNKFYKKENEFTNKDLIEFIEENKDQLKIEYLDFKYLELNPQNLIGVNEFNQSFFDLSHTFLIILIMHIILGLPFAYYLSSLALNSIAKEIKEAANILGCAKNNFWHRIYLPLTKNYILAGIIFSYGISLGEFG